MAVGLLFVFRCRQANPYCAQDVISRLALFVTSKKNKEINNRKLQSQMQALIKDGKVVQIGTRRWAKYRLSE